MDVLSLGTSPSSSQRGSIQIVAGPMFSGKTTELLHRLRRLGHAKKHCMLVRYCRDTRYSVEKVATHDRDTNCGPDCTTFSVNRLAELPVGAANTYDVVGIDEGQFFPDLVSFADRLANAGKVVIVAGLDGDFLRQPFGGLCDLVPRSESFHKLNAICQGKDGCCGRLASFSTRISADKGVEVIGGADKYIPTCRDCYAKHSSQKLEIECTKADGKGANLITPVKAASGSKKRTFQTPGDTIETSAANDDNVDLKDRKENQLDTTPKSVVGGPGIGLRSDIGSGRLELVIGPMFSSKTTKLVHLVRRQHYARRSVLLVRYLKDNRYSEDSLATHDNVLQLNFDTKSVTQLCQLGDAFFDYDVIGIDEGQFYPDLAEFTNRATAAGKTVIIAALDGDFLRQPFGDICQLIPRAEEIYKLTAVCVKCGCHAAFSKRITAEQDIEVIGGADKYIPTCRECYNGVEELVLGKVPPLVSQNDVKIQSESKLLFVEDGR